MSHQKTEWGKTSGKFCKGVICKALSQSFMDLELSCTSSLPWIWVVETLAHSNQIDTYLLIDLLEKTPKIADDDIGGNAREAVSLKILENFFVQRAPAIPESSSSHSIEKIKLDPSDSCEDVLRRMLAEKYQQASPSGLKLADLELDKWDLQSFIQHKRSSLAVYTLKQLKAAILTGKNSLLASLKEQSGLSVGNQPENGARIDPRLSTSVERLLLVNAAKKRIQSENQVEPNNGSVKKHKPDAIFSEPYMGDKSMPSGEDTQLPNASAAACIEHNDGGRCNLDKTNHIGNVGIDDGDNEQQQTSPKGLARLDEVLHPGKGHEYDIRKANGNNISSGKGGINYDGTDFATKNNTSLDQQLPANCNECTSSEAIGGCDEVVPQCETEIKNYKFDGKQMKDHDANFDKLEQNISRKSPNVKEAKGVDLAIDSNELLLDENTSVDAMKKTFLSSQRAYGQDSLATTDRMELDLCMKCNKGGELLVCSSDSCSIVIHVSCLGSDASAYDTNGKFYCPFCAYSQAISKYMEVKKQASLARKHVATFIRSVGNQKESEEHSYKKKKDATEKVRNHRQRKEVENEPAGPSGMHSYHNLCSMRNDISSINRIVAHGLDKDKKEGEKTIEISCQSLRIHEKQQKDELGIHKSLREKTSHRVSKRSGVFGNYVDIRSKKGAVSDEQKDISSKSGSFDLFETSDEDYKSGSSCSTKVRKQKAQFSYPRIPLLRRKILPWTSAEENALKEGVRLLSNPGDKIMPWTKILEFGTGVFDKSRTTVDLKDKWRNMCKAAV
ncbi:uncharacterized protein LOC127249291 isoform X2 [Andrographis paniculata]|uniref:uncharacterized protein LOC127249291 isoform X2 n=1 Tax=Andrographis paniculata TaxID=175694 RepID=UPI0021E82A75|nr:uncharacterized protein LOC127249291 isoform X2 [Andrographis paniculata]